jgi:hypothetical protein
MLEIDSRNISKYWKIPVLFPAGRDLTYRDWFKIDCIHHHPFRH